MPEYPNPKLRPVPEPPQAAGPARQAYTELDVVTNFSFLRGASHADELVYRAAKLGYRAIAVTDRNSLAGAVRMYEAAKQTGLKLLTGARLVFADAPDLLVWAPDRAAYAKLCRLLTAGKRRAEKGHCVLRLNDFLDDGDGLLGALVPPAAGGIDRQTEHAVGLLRGMMGDRLSLAASLLYAGNERGRMRDLLGLSQGFDVPLLATNAVHYHEPGRRALQDVLTCVRLGCTIQEAGYHLFPNGERYLKSPARMHRLFADFPQALRRGVEIAERCTFSLGELQYEYPDELVPPGQTPAQHLRELTERGAKKRYPHGVPTKVRGQIEHELILIGQLGYEAYFLTVYDLVRYARSRGILCQGRGSAANSAVCYCLEVTSVDPAATDLLFERFVSAARNEPPDIDIDFEHERREEVIQYVYEKYGRERAGMTAEVITYRGRSAVRDVGKALGLSLDMVDQMAKRLDWWHTGTLTAPQLREVGLDPEDRTIRLVVELTRQLLGFPRHLSQHVGGMVMTRGPLCEMVPIENASMPDRTVIEWDKDDIDVVGILKVDVLALGMLTAISRCFRLVDSWTDELHASPRRGEPCVRPPPTLEDIRVRNRNRNRIRIRRGEACLRPLVALGDPDERANTRFAPTEDAADGRTRLDCARRRQGSPLQLHTVPPDDPAVYAMISNADTVGVFQIESRAQMSMLPRLKPKNFYDLVIEVAIVRPGPIQGDMVHPYLRRRNKEEPVVYPSEALRQVLEKTLGVPLFQEQAMKVAMVAAGFTADEADQLRRAMAAWKRTTGLERFHDKMVNGMLRNGYTPEFAEQCFHQIKGFGEYGFPESHAASFALLVYVSAWLKCYHPAAFTAALLNSQPMGFYAPAQLVRDAKDHGVEVRPADVNFSDWDCTLEAAAGEGGRGRGGDEENAVRPRRDRSSATVRILREDDPGRRKAPPAACVVPLSPPLPLSPSPPLPPALRLGLRLIKGLHVAHARRIEAARARGGPFTSVHQLRRRTGLPRHTLRRLAEADAFGSMGLSRREALWQVLSVDDAEAPLFDQLPDSSEPGEAVAHLPAMPIGQEVMTDYATAGLSLKRHPVALVRDELKSRRVITAAELKETPAGKWVRVAGLVLIRQRPGTAMGIVFETLEDETGVANLIVRPDVYDRYRPAARHAAMVQADGYVERQGQVIHVMVKRLVDLSGLLDGYSGRSRDFH